MNAVDEIAIILIQSIKSMAVVLNILWNTGKYITRAWIIQRNEDIYPQTTIGD
jgi:hypothetical protein